MVSDGENGNQGVEVEEEVGKMAGEESTEMAWRGKVGSRKRAKREKRMDDNESICSLIEGGSLELSYIDFMRGL